MWSTTRAAVGLVGPAQLARQARTWIAAGARVLGGCFGTTPEHIRALLFF